jgi:group I intron endonuclease
MTPIIYKILNIKNNKVYIGSTNRGHHRLNEHKKKLQSGKHTNKHLQSSWDINGENSFLFEIIEYVEFENNLIEREQYWIDYYFERFNMYNIRKTADRNIGIKHSKETLLLLKDISNKHFKDNGHKSVYEFWLESYGKDIADRKMIDYRIKLSEGSSGEKNPMYGKTGELNPNIKKIGQFLKDGTFLKEWNGIIIASKELSILAQNISECCLGKRKSAGGYIWKFLELKTNK